MPVTRVTGRERLAWAMYDFANSGYTTVVLTTLFNGYFVGVIAAGAGFSAGAAVLLWTGAIAAGNAIVLISAPIVGAAADLLAAKKRFLAIATAVCVTATALLGLLVHGHVWLVTLLVVISFVGFGSGEYLIAAFLPEITTEDRMGRLSGQAWGLGYVGGVLTLVLCLVWIVWTGRVRPASDSVPAILWITAMVYLLAAMPTFIWLKERAVAASFPLNANLVSLGLRNVLQTLRHARRFTDLFRFLTTMVVFQAGVSTVIIVATIYAQEVFGFDTKRLVLLVILVNLTAAGGALMMGQMQDRIGSIPALATGLGLWTLAIVLVVLARSEALVWIAANLIGIAMGGCQSVSRALIGLLTPSGRSGEFFGLWGLGVNLASIVGPLSYGLVSLATGGNHRLAVLSTLVFFIVGLAMLTGIDEQRGKRAAALSVALPGDNRGYW